MDAGKRRLAIALVLGGLALSIFSVVALATAKPSSFSCSGATKTCTWVHTNLIGLTSTDTFPLTELEESHIAQHHAKRGTSYEWEIRATAGHLDLADVDHAHMAEYEAYAAAVQKLIDHPTNQTIGITFDPEDPDVFGCLLIGAIIVFLAAVLWRRGADTRVTFDREARTVRVVQSPWVLRRTQAVPQEGLRIEALPFRAYVMGQGNRDFLRVTIWTYNRPVASWKVPAGRGGRNEDVERMREVLAS